MRYALAFGTILLAACAQLGCGGGSTGGNGGDDDQVGDDDGSSGPDAMGNPVEERQGCDGATFLGTSTDPAVKGPWPVGAKTVMIGRLKTEIWYPATPGSEVGKDKVRYDIRESLNPRSQDVIPDADNPWQEADAYRDLPLDTAHGPYPVVVFVHGTAAFRHQSATQTTHWASRGFVVIAADHPGLMLGDLLAGFCQDQSRGQQDLSGDVDAELAALAAPTGDMAFLAGHLDISRTAVTGHSAGGGAASQSSGKPNVRVVMPLAAPSSTQDSPTLENVLYMGGLKDGIAQWNNVKSGYNGSASPRELVGIANSGHLVFSDLCSTTNSSGKNLLEIADQYQLCGAQFASFLFDCDPTYLDQATGSAIVNAATSTVLEQTLQCRTDLPPLSELQGSYPDVAEYDESL